MEAALRSISPRLAQPISLQKGPPSFTFTSPLSSFTDAPADPVPNSSSASRVVAGDRRHQVLHQPRVHTTKQNPPTATTATFPIPTPHLWRLAAVVRLQPPHRLSQTSDDAVVAPERPLTPVPRRLGTRHRIHWPLTPSKL